MSAAVMLNEGLGGESDSFADEGIGDETLRDCPCEGVADEEVLSENCRLSAAGFDAFNGAGTS